MFFFYVLETREYTNIDRAADVWEVNLNWFRRLDRQKGFSLRRKQWHI